MDFSKYDKLRNLVPKEPINKVNIGDVAAYKIGFVSIIFSMITLIHYIHYMNIQYSTTAIARFFQFFIMFYVIITIGIYFRYSMNTIVFYYFIFILIPYLYYLIEYVYKLTQHLSLYTVSGRIYLLTTIMTIFAIGLITNNMHIVAILLAIGLVGIALSQGLKVIGKMITKLEKGE